nr:Glycoside hydrolase [Ipomoea batatas]
MLGTRSLYCYGFLYSSWNGKKMHTNYHFLTEILKNKFGFKNLGRYQWPGLMMLLKGSLESNSLQELDINLVGNQRQNHNWHNHFGCTKRSDGRQNRNNL